MGSGKVNKIYNLCVALACAFFLSGCFDNNPTMVCTCSDGVTMVVRCPEGMWCDWNSKEFPDEGFCVPMKVGEHLSDFPPPQDTNEDGAGDGAGGAPAGSDDPASSPSPPPQCGDGVVQPDAVACQNSVEAGNCHFFDGGADGIPACVKECPEGYIVPSDGGNICQPQPVEGDFCDPTSLENCEIAEFSKQLACECVLCIDGDLQAPFCQCTGEGPSDACATHKGNFCNGEGLCSCEVSYTEAGEQCKDAGVVDEKCECTKCERDEDFLPFCNRFSDVCQDSPYTPGNCDSVDEDTPCYFYENEEKCVSNCEQQDGNYENPEQPGAPCVPSCADPAGEDTCQPVGEVECLYLDDGIHARCVKECPHPYKKSDSNRCELDCSESGGDSSYACTSCSLMNGVVKCNTCENDVDYELSVDGQCNWIGPIGCATTLCWSGGKCTTPGPNGQFKCGNTYGHFNNCSGCTVVSCHAGYHQNGQSCVANTWGLDITFTGCDVECGDGTATGKSHTCTERLASDGGYSSKSACDQAGNSAPLGDCSKSCPTGQVCTSSQCKDKCDAGYHQNGQSCVANTWVLDITFTDCDVECGDGTATGKSHTCTERLASDGGYSSKSACDQAGNSAPSLGDCSKSCPTGQVCTSSQCKDKCDGVSCNNRGSCVAETGKCNCDVNYSGDYCQSYICYRGEPGNCSENWTLCSGGSFCDESGGCWWCRAQ